MNTRAILVLSATFSGVALAGPGDIHYVKTLQAPIHTKPSSESEVKFIIAVGHKLTVKPENYRSWRKVALRPKAEIHANAVCLTSAPMEQI